MTAALLGGQLGGAALDVFEARFIVSVHTDLVFPFSSALTAQVEPLPDDSTLWLCGDRLLLTAHNADYTENYFQ